MSCLIKIKQFYNYNHYIRLPPIETLTKKQINRAKKNKNKNKKYIEVCIKIYKKYIYIYTNMKIYKYMEMHVEKYLYEYMQSIKKSI